MKKIIPIITIGILILSGYAVIGNTAFNNENYDFIVITPDMFHDELITLKEHKVNHGISTKIVTLDDIYNGIYFSAIGEDAPEKIKHFIKNANNNWGTVYVMLVGGKELLPVRYSVIQSYNSSMMKYSNFFPDICTIDSNEFITDLYYADLYSENGSFCSWNSNGNSIFGEIGLDDEIDEVDLYPDVYVGRLLCQTSEQVRCIVNKIIEYENNAFGKEWFNNFILMGGDTHPNTWEEILLSIVFKNITGKEFRIAWEGEYMSEQLASLLDTFTAKKYYASGFLGMRAERLINKNINEAINDGAGFLIFNAHGSPTRLVTYPPFNKKRSIQIPYPSGYDISNFDELTNDDKLPVTVFSACSCGDFDKVPTPIAWEFVKIENGGGIASFALTTGGNIYPTTACVETLTGHTTMSVLEAYSDGFRFIGEIWAETIRRYLDDDFAWSINEFLNSDGLPVVWLNYLTIEEWILFGDPSLKIGGYP